MYDPEQILAWMQVHIHGMRRSRLKTLAAVVSGALVMKGVGVLALGRAMAGRGEIGAKHCIKRVWRFLRNPGVELEAVHAGLLASLCPARGPVVVLADWTDLGPFQQLVFSLPRDGRALPFLSVTVPKGQFRGDQDGSMIYAEGQALTSLKRICPPGRQLVLVADRGFGHGRWLWEVQRRGWQFVQRLSSTQSVEVRDYIGALGELGIPQDSPARDWGPGALSTHPQVRLRLISVHAAQAQEPWYLVSSVDEAPAAEIVRIYKRRMWIEAMFRDLKNRNWGLGLDNVRLSEPIRHDRHFLVLALAYAILCAFGAAAETLELDKHLKANTAPERVMSLARIGNYVLQLAHCSIDFAFRALHSLPP
jgi:hypothetical protein